MQLILAAAVTLGASVRAEAAPLAQIADSVKQSAAIGPQEQAAILGAVNTAIGLMSDASDPAAQQTARNWFIQSVSDAAGNVGSDAYIKAYTQTVNAQFLAMLAKPGVNFRAKVQAGLATEEIGVRCDGTPLVPFAAKLLKDPLPSVELVGMKAANGLLPAVFADGKIGPAEKDLLEAMLDTVARNPNPPLGGPIVEEAYNALGAPAFSQRLPIKPAVAAKFLVPRIFKLQALRIGIYQNALPCSPNADSTGVVIVFSHDIWGALDIGQQKEAIKNTGALIGLEGKWAAQIKAGNGDSAPLISAMRSEGTELHLFFDPARGVVPNGQFELGVHALGTLAPASASAAIRAASQDAIKVLTDFEATLP